MQLVHSRKVGIKVHIMDVTGEEMQLKGSRTLDPLQDLSMHVQMFSNFLGVFPVHYQELDPNRMALLYFVVGALDLLGNLSLVNKEAVIDWIYAQQVTSRISGQDCNLFFELYPSSLESLFYFCMIQVARCGFACGPLSGSKFDSLVESIDPSAHQYHESHIAMTYSALCVLKMLGDDFGRLDKAAIINSLKFFQLPNGSFRCLGRSSEDDMRFVFCA